MRFRVCAAAVVVVGCGLAGAIPVQAASAAAYSVTIRAQSNVVVKPYTLVVFGDASVHNGLRYDEARLSGEVSGAKSGDTARLYAQAFGAKGFTADGKPIALTGTSPQSYSFTVKPTIATAYKVVVATGSTVDTTSSTATVYMATNQNYGPNRQHCTHARCTNSFTFYTRLPASAYKTEAAKPWFFYIAVGSRKVPKFVYLSKRVTISRASKVNSHEFAVTFTFTTAGTNPPWWTEVCTKDSESRDGLGLPSHHGCGAKRLNTSANYVG
jgi:hypothetical protein